MSEIPKQVMRRDVQNILEIINQESNVTRYSRDFMVHKESVLEHVGFVASFIMFVGMRTNQNGLSVNVGAALGKAVIHDKEEILTGDVPRPTKYCSPDVTKGLKAYEHRAMVQLEKVSKCNLLWDWKIAKDESIEGRLVALADIAAVVYKCLSEISMYGNKSFLRVLDEITPIVDEALYSAQFPECFAWVLEELQDLIKRIYVGDVRHGEFFKGIL
jgi:5'-deoxynucleotidase YfbR-like HD superfamily hydrolase